MGLVTHLATPLATQPSSSTLIPPSLPLANTIHSSRLMLTVSGSTRKMLKLPAMPVAHSRVASTATSTLMPTVKTLSALTTSSTWVKTSMVKSVPNALATVSSTNSPKSNSVTSQAVLVNVTMLSEVDTVTTLFKLLSHDQRRTTSLSTNSVSCLSVSKT